jgi:hypothetical protein
MYDKYKIIKQDDGFFVSLTIVGWIEKTVIPFAIGTPWFSKLRKPQTQALLIKLLTLWTDSNCIRRAKLFCICCKPARAGTEIVFKSF